MSSTKQMGRNTSQLPGYKQNWTLNLNDTFDSVNAAAAAAINNSMMTNSSVSNSSKTSA
jgi:hypothetical protein